MEKIWPGGLTLVLPASPAIPAALTAGTGKIGIRLPAHPVARALVAAVGRPITGTSANVSGRSGCSRIAALDLQIAAAAELILDAGHLAGGVGSTVVDATRRTPVILRSGAVSDDKIRMALTAD
jgi:L-threonylcarbamoyladenylate synthase